MTTGWRATREMPAKLVRTFHARVLRSDPFTKSLIRRTDAIASSTL